MKQLGLSTATLLRVEVDHPVVVCTYVNPGMRNKPLFARKINV
jgi:hypothetical protein